MSMQRREFLKLAGGTSALTAVSGCATMGGGPAGRVVVVGGGYGGATVAKYLRMWSGGSVDVTLIEPNAEFISCPMSNLVLGGSKRIADVTVSYANLAKRWGVTIVRDSAVAVDADKRTLRLAGGAKVLLEGAFTADDLYNLVSDLLADPAQLAQMAQNMKSAGVADAAERIADLVLKLADRHAK